MKFEFKASSPHLHECTCGVVWAHDPGKRAVDLGYPPGIEGICSALNCSVCYRRQYDKSHECPECGAYKTLCAPPSMTPNYYWDGKLKMEWDEYVRTQLDNKRDANRVPHLPDNGEPQHG